MKYAIIVERGKTSYGAYVPDLPGCVAVADTKEEVMKLIEEAIRLHIETMQEQGEYLPQPHSEASYIEI
jgi:predicted RNase H-like HicB family nuclease